MHGFVGSDEGYGCRGVRLLGFLTVGCHFGSVCRFWEELVGVVILVWVLSLLARFQ